MIPWAVSTRLRQSVRHNPGMTPRENLYAVRRNAVLLAEPLRKLADSGRPVPKFLLLDARLAHIELIAAAAEAVAGSRRSTRPH